MRRAGILAAVLLLLIAPRQLLAADSDDADALIKQGLLLRRQGKDTEALDDFRRAFALDPSARNRAQVALAEQALGHWLDAEADLAKALEATGDPWIVRNRGLLESGLESIRSRLGWLEVTADVPGAEVWVNDARVGTLPLDHPIRLEAGSAVIEIRAAGYAPARRTTAIEPGGRAREAVHLVPLAPSSAGAGEATPGPGEAPVERVRLVPADRPVRNVGYVLAASGVLGLAAGAYFGARTLQDKNDRDLHCQPGCDRTGVALDQEARTFALRSTVWLSAGLVTLVTGAGLLWVSRSHSVRESAGSVGLVPEIGPDRAVVQVRGSW